MANDLPPLDDLMPLTQEELEECILRDAEQMIRALQEQKKTVKLAEAADLSDGQPVNSLLETRGAEILTPGEIVSIQAMAEHVADLYKFSKENVYYLLETEFNASNHAAIRREDFNAAIVFLVDMQDISGVH